MLCIKKKALFSVLNVLTNFKEHAICISALYTQIKHRPQSPEIIKDKLFLRFEFLHILAKNLHGIMRKGPSMLSLELSKGYISHQRRIE